MSDNTATVLETDVLIVGGGVNGAGVARDLAGRGIKVVLCEKDDLASHTSSSSTKLIHGGLRYLEHYEFSLVRKALQEREVLLASAPHIMHAMRFVMPHDPSMRPAWMIRLGLLLYDHLAHREVLPGAQTLDLRAHPAGAPLKAAFTRGFAYSDGWVDDARLVLLNARDAANRGARVFTRTACVQAQADAQGWQARLERDQGTPLIIRAKALVNAAGPWAARFIEGPLKRKDSHGLRLIKGSHIVVPRIFDHPMAYIFQSPDRRIVFAIPYERDFTLIGTTDVEHPGDLDRVEISTEEISYLCELVSRYFAKPVTPADVVWSYSGVRPLLDDASGNPSAVTRDYLLELDTSGPPLLSIWGGKITTFRKLAEEVGDRLLPAINRPRPAWTASASLPGGDLQTVIGRRQRPDQDFEAFLRKMGQQYSWLPQPLLERYAHAYGTLMIRMLRDAGSLAALGEQVAPGLYEAELRYLVSEEWARSADDVLWRRSKLGLHMTAAERARVAQWFDARPPEPSGVAS